MVEKAVKKLFFGRYIFFNAYNIKHLVNEHNVNNLLYVSNYKLNHNNIHMDVHIHQHLFYLFIIIN